MPGAVGISLALPGRPVAAIVGDGSAMYGIQGLWTAAHEKLPITYVIANNRGYRIIKERLVAMRKTDTFTGMDIREPDIDFVALGNVARPELDTSHRPRRTSRPRCAQPSPAAGRT